MERSPGESCVRRGTQEGKRPGQSGDLQPPAAGEPSAPTQQPQPEGSSGYRVIQPNEAKRSHVQAIARKEMEDLERWKEAHKASPIKLAPRKLGGIISESEARGQQQLGLQQSKYQQKLKRDEYKRKLKEEEEAKIQKMKTIQREKAIQLEQKRRQQDEQRRQDQHLKNNELLSKLEIRTPYNYFSQNDSFGQESNAWGREYNPWEQESAASSQESNAWAKSHTYAQNRKEEEQKRLQQMKEEQQRKSELLELKRKKDEREQIETRQSEQRRVNNAFLDRLENANQPDSAQHDYFRNAHNAFGYSYHQAN